MLSAGVPGGFATVAVALAVVAAGVASYWRQSRTATALMLLPPICTGAAVMALSHNLWPRFFFFSAGFAVLIAIRGGFVTVHWVVDILAPHFLPRRWRARRAEHDTPQTPVVASPLAIRLATAGAAAVATLSMTTVPRAWAPKQDFEGARAFVEARHGPNDGIAGVDQTGYVYTRYYRRPWPNLASAAELRALEAAHPRTWVLVTLPGRVALVQPALWEHLRRDYRMAATFPGTAGGADVYVFVNR